MPAGRATRKPSIARQAGGQPLDLAAEPGHVVVAGRRVVLQGGLGGPLDERRAARGRRVDQLADRLDHLGMGDREPIRQPLMLYDLLKV